MNIMRDLKNHRSKFILTAQRNAEEAQHKIGRIRNTDDYSKAHQLLSTAKSNSLIALQFNNVIVKLTGEPEDLYLNIVIDYVKSNSSELMHPVKQVLFNFIKRNMK